MTEKQLAQRVGVTQAGLKFLASLAATGKASIRGNETARLAADGLIDVGEGGTRQWWQITEAGRQAVQNARRLGW